MLVEAGLGRDEPEELVIVLGLLKAVVLWLERKERSWRRFFSRRSWRVLDFEGGRKPSKKM